MTMKKVSLAWWIGKGWLGIWARRKKSLLTVVNDARLCVLLAIVLCLGQEFGAPRRRLPLAGKPSPSGGKVIVSRRVPSAITCVNLDPRLRVWCNRELAGRMRYTVLFRAKTRQTTVRRGAPLPCSACQRIQHLTINKPWSFEFFSLDERGRFADGFSDSTRACANSTCRFALRGSL